jgi:acyl-CoA synthetase (AMP-forming)/AMP-acid ligase II
VTGAIQTIPAAVRAAAETFGDAVAVAEPGGPTLSYRDLHEHVRQAATALIANGIEPGDRVAIWSPNTHHWVIAGLGALCAGATLVPVNTRFTGPEALDIIARSGARVLFVARPFLGADRLALLTSAAAQAGGALPGLIVQIPVEHDGPAAPGSGTALGWTAFRHGRTASATTPTNGRGSLARRRQRHPVHIGDHGAEQGRDVRASPGA